MTAEELAPLFNIGWSGFTGVGYPKTVPTAIANHIEANNLQDDPATKKKFNLFVGASVGPEVEDRWARLNMIARRYPHQVGKDIAKGINAGRIEFADKHLSSASPFSDTPLTSIPNEPIVFPQDLTYGYYSLRRNHGDPSKPLDWAIIEATAITEEGGIVPGASVGATPEILQSAEKIIIEVNTRIPNLEGLHDINQSFLPPHRQPYTVSLRLSSPIIPITGQNSPEPRKAARVLSHLCTSAKHENRRVEPAGLGEALGTTTYTVHALVQLGSRVQLVSAAEGSGLGGGSRARREEMVVVVMSASGDIDVV
ncbi:Acetyl-CoA hydrolase [Psilocybe cubensis]|uniref:Acetyl-CoA hydrolase n=1 Tax=Psilocybe cubensis TaxID=181762 RepID=A0ACB8GQI2_PSICU|nr:Acetyl-CoA hydrolase [Psilocybe cubensis]KAH9477677.1 Acetyl-CoA hydrolase [Psilocybe cubensis]